MSNEPKETNLFGASVSQKLDIFRYTEQDGERACHIAQAADDARTLEAEVKRLADENDALRKSAQEADAFLCLLSALSGEVPNDGDKPHPSQDKGSDG